MQTKADKHRAAGTLTQFRARQAASRAGTARYRERALAEHERVLAERRESAAALEDMAELGRALMIAIDVHAPKGWHPADCPSEIVGDLSGENEELRTKIECKDAAIAECVSAMAGVLRVADRQTDEFDAVRAAIAKYRGR